MMWEFSPEEAKLAKRREKRNYRCMMCVKKKLFNFLTVLELFLVECSQTSFPITNCTFRVCLHDASARSLAAPVHVLRLVLSPSYSFGLTLTATASVS